MIFIYRYVNSSIHYLSYRNIFKIIWKCLFYGKHAKNPVSRQNQSVCEVCVVSVRSGELSWQTAPQILLGLLPEGSPAAWSCDFCHFLLRACHDSYWVWGSDLSVKNRKLVIPSVVMNERERISSFGADVWVWWFCHHNCWSSFTGGTLSTDMDDNTFPGLQTNQFSHR